MAIHINTDDNKKTFYKHLILLSLPIALQNLLVSSLSFADTLMVSKLGNAPLAAVGVANQIYIFINFIFFGVAAGTQTFFAQYYGRKEWEKVRRVSAFGTLIVLVVALFFALVTFTFPKEVMRIFSKDENVIFEGVRYLQMVAFSYIGPGITQVLSSGFRTEKKPHIPLIITVCAGLLNIFLNWIFIYGKLGFSPLGAKGAALATLICRFVELISIALASWIVINKKKNEFAFKIADINFPKNFVKNFFILSLPIILDESFWGLGNMLYKVAFSIPGTVALAAMNITESITNFFVIAIMAISNAAVILLGGSLGQGKLEKAERESKYVLILGALSGIVLGILEIILAPFFSSLFGVSGDVRLLSINAMRMYALAIPFRTIAVVIIVGILRSGGDTRAAFILEMSTLYFIGIPLAFILAICFKCNLDMLYISILVEAIVKMLLCYKRMKSKKWLKIID